jgi:hypothetical protein
LDGELLKRSAIEGVDQQRIGTALDQLSPEEDKQEGERERKT